MDIDKEINRIAFDIRAFEHASEEMKNYLKDHPQADPQRPLGQEEDNKRQDS